MSVLPQSKVARIGWCEQHINPFSTNATAIGTTSAAVTDLEAKTAAARAAWNAQKEAMNAAKSATNTYHIAVDAMTDAVSDIIKQVKAQAAISGNSVYSLADIPAPATPGPIGPLGTPHHFVATLDGAGGLELGWKCTNPKSAGGTVYQVWRRIGGAGEFSFLGNAGEKKFLDTTIPAGSSEVTYQIRAVRSTSAGGWAQFNVNFGMSSGGGMTASVTESPKIAA